MLRLRPGEDVRNTLREWVNTLRIEAAAVTSAVGSLTTAHLRHADRADGIVTTADMEVLTKAERSASTACICT